MANEFKVKKGLIVQGSGSVGDNTILDVQGNQGQLFSITDSLSGSLFSVGDISGIPILEVFSDEIVKIGTFGSEGLIVNGSNVTSSGNISSSGMGTFAQVRIGESTTTNYGLIVDYPDTRLLRLKRGGSTKFQVIADSSDGQVDIYDNSGNSDIRLHADNNSYFTNNLGIGTTSPVEKLHIVGNISASGAIQLGATVPIKLLVNGGAPNDSTEFRNGGGEFKIYSGRTTNAKHQSFVFSSGDNYTSGATRMVITGSSGNVGIGTTSPAEKLTVEGNISSSGNLSLGNGGDGASRLMVVDSDKQLTLEKSPGGYFTSFGYDSNQNYITYYSSPGMLIGYGSTTGAAPTVNTLFLKQDGKVGIGTTSPSENLHVSESIRIGYPTGKLFAKATDAFFGEIIPFNASGHMKLNVSYPGGNIIFQSGSTEVARFKDGKLGIGTTSPSKKLHVYSTGNGEALIERASGAQILLQAQAAAGVVGTSTNHDLDLKTNGSTRIKVENAGNVGIGTTSPSQTLEVHSTIKIGETGVTGGRLISGDSMIFQIDSDASSGTSSYRFRANGTGDDGTELMRIGENGKVGIGTTAPTELLQVAGNISASGNITAGAGDTVVISGTGIVLNRSNAYIQSDADNSDTLNIGQSSVRWGHVKLDAADFAVLNGGNERMRVASSGNVGIGTTTPSEPLTVAGNISASGTIKANGGTLTGNLVFTQPSDIRFANGQIIDDNGSGGLRIYTPQHSTDIYSGLSGNLRLFTSQSVERLRIDNAGNVGIGTITSNEALIVAGNISASGDLAIQGFTSVSASLAAAGGSGADNIIVLFPEPLGPIIPILLYLFIFKSIFFKRTLFLSS